MQQSQSSRPSAGYRILNPSGKQSPIPEVNEMTQRYGELVDQILEHEMQVSDPQTKQWSNLAVANLKTSIGYLEKFYTIAQVESLSQNGGGQSSRQSQFSRQREAEYQS